MRAALPPEYRKRTILKQFRFIMIIIPIRKPSIECGQKFKDHGLIHRLNWSNKLNILNQ